MPRRRKRLRPQKNDDIAKYIPGNGNPLCRLPVTVAIADGSTAIKITLIFSSLVVIAAIFLGYFLTCSIVHPLREAVSIAENVAAGDLRTVIHVNSRTKPAS